MVVQELFEIDLAQLEKVAIQFDKGDENRRDFKGIYAECATILRQVSNPQIPLLTPNLQYNPFGSHTVVKCSTTCV